MRAIEFRGLRTDGKGWAYGSILQTNQSIYIVPIGTNEVVYHGHDHVHHSDLYKVNPATVGQFTGLYDRNGVKIFGGDNVTINGKEYFIRFNMGVFVAESVTANHLSLLPWEFNGTDITVTGNLHEPATVRE